MKELSISILLVAALLCVSAASLLSACAENTVPPASASNATSTPSPTPAPAVEKGDGGGGW